MAWTTTKVSQFNSGNNVLQLWKLTADSATLELKTGLGYINAVLGSAQLAASSPVKFSANALSAGTATNGYISVTGAASSDIFFVTVYGR